MARYYSIKSVVNGKMVKVPFLQSVGMNKPANQKLNLANAMVDIRKLQKMFNFLLRHNPYELRPYQGSIDENGINDGGYFVQLIAAFQKNQNIQGVERQQTVVLQNGPTIQKLSALVMDIQCTAQTPQNAVDLMKLPEVRAMMETTAWAEGTNNNYHKLVNGKVMKTPISKYQKFIGQHSKEVPISLDRHPEIYIEWAKGEKLSTAAGRYQFLHETWEEMRKLYWLTDFGPWSQDIAVVGKFIEKKMIRPLLLGEYSTAIRNGNHTWASFPESPYNQHPKSMDEFIGALKQNLNRFSYLDG